MKIGIYIGDSRPESGGAYTFQKDIIDSLKQFSNEHEYFVFTTYADSIDFDSEVKIVSTQLKGYQKVYYKLSSSIKSIESFIKRKRTKRVTHLFRLMKKHGIDIAWFMSTTFEDPGIPYVFTVWDLAHKYFPFFPEITTQGWKFEEREKFYSEAIAKAAVIITGTAIGKNDIVNFFDIPSERVTIIPFATPQYTLDLQDKHNFNSLLDSSRDFVFYPAQFWPHKNHIIILRALKILKEKFGRVIDVVFTGSDKGNLEFIKSQTELLGIEDQVHFHGFVSREQLIGLYKNAKMLVFPSQFGPDNLPPLEAFALGCPVVASDIPGASEQLGDNVLLFNPNDEDDLANCMLSVLDNSKLKNDLIEKGIARARSWTSFNYTTRVLGKIDELKSLIGLWKDVRRKKIKILHINTFDTVGGASRVAYNLVNNMDVDSTLAVMKKKSTSKRVIQLQQNIIEKFFFGIDKVIWKLGYKKSIKNIFSIADQFNFTWHKLQKMKEYREADIIHLHNIHGNYFDLSALRKIAAEKHIVWTLHDMWVMTGGEAYTFKNENYKKGIGKTPYINVYPLLNPLIDRRQHFIDLKKRIYEDIGAKLTLVPVSRWLENCITNAYVNNKKIKIRLNYNGINLSIFKNYRRRSWEKPRLLFFNMDSPFKGSRLFLNVLNRINGEFDLTIVGEPIKLNIKHRYIKFTDSREYLSEIYNDADILIFPSLAESFGLTVIEALACGVCVIASDEGGIPEVLDDSSGYLFKSGDEDDLLNKINYALKNFNESRRKGDIASNNVENFSLEVSCNGYMEIYRQILYSNENRQAGDIHQMKAKTNVPDFMKTPVQ